MASSKVLQIMVDHLDAVTLLKALTSDLPGSAYVSGDDGCDNDTVARCTDAFRLVRYLDESEAPGQCC